MNARLPPGQDHEQAIDPEDFADFLVRRIRRRGRPMHQHARLQQLWNQYKPQLMQRQRARWLQQAADWRVYGIVDTVTVQIGPTKSRSFLVLGVFVREPDFAKVTSVAPNRLDGLPSVGSLRGPARDVLMPVAARAARLQQRCELASLWLFDESRLLGFREVVRLLGTASSLHLDAARFEWWFRLRVLKSRIDTTRRVVGGPSTVPQMKEDAKRLIPTVRARQEEAIDRAAALARSRVAATDARWAEASHDLAVIDYNIHLTRNTDRQHPSGEYEQLMRSWGSGPRIPAASVQGDRPLGQRKESSEEEDNLLLARLYRQTVNRMNRRAGKVVPAQVVTDRRALQALVTRPMWDLELHGLDLDDDKVRDLVNETLLVVGRESPSVSKTDRELLEATFKVMALCKKLLRTEQGVDRKLAGEMGEALMSLWFVDPGQKRPASWGVTDFYMKATLYFAYEEMRAGPRFWKNARRELLRLRGKSIADTNLPRYRVCAFADFLLRNRHRIHASPHRPYQYRRCWNPIITGDDVRDACCGEACRKNLSAWRRRLRASRSA